MSEGPPFTHYLVPREDLEGFIDTMVRLKVRGHEKGKARKLLKAALLAQYLRVNTKSETESDLDLEKSSRSD